jgi:hypothetical protein
MFLNFRDGSDVKWIQSFCHVVFFGKSRTVIRRNQRGKPRGAKRVHHMAKKSGHVVGHIFSLMGQIDANFGLAEPS